MQRSFEGAQLYRTARDVYHVAVLRGDWRAMGRQYGGLLGDMLRSFHDEITADVAARGVDAAEQLATAREVGAVLSQNLNELLDGMAETSGLSHDEVLVLNAGMMLLTGAVLGGEPPSACSGIAAWGAASPGGRLVFGRDWDIDRASMLRYMKYLGVVVFNPDSGIPFANVHPLGNVYVETGMNSKGVFIELNNGEQSDPEYYEDREDTSSYLAEVLQKAGSVDEAVALLEAKPADISYILQVADAGRAVSVERPTFGCRVRDGEDGVLAAYNSFVPPYPAEWDGRIAPPPPATQDPRYENLIELARSPRFYGQLDAPAMMELLEVPIDQGGALHDGTVLQVVAAPKDLTLWIRGVEHSDFEKVDLRGLFDR